jgi:hypothetical protein
MREDQPQHVQSSATVASPVISTVLAPAVSLRLAAPVCYAPAMPHTFEDAFALVQSLARDFEANKAHFLSTTYQESEVRKDFIDKFLIALGWDVNHDWQKSPFEQEVKVERRLYVCRSIQKGLHE